MGTNDQHFLRRIKLRNELVAQFGEPEDFTQLLELASGNITQLLEKVCDDIELRYVAIEVRYSALVSNSNSSPISGVSNWSNDPEKPTGYPGFSGRVWLGFSGDRAPHQLRLRELSISTSDLLVRSYIHPGTGWYGDYRRPEGLRAKHNYTWDCKIFLSDWPKIEASMIMDLLTDNIDLKRPLFYEWCR